MGELPQRLSDRDPDVVSRGHGPKPARAEFEGNRAIHPPEKGGEVRKVEKVKKFKNLKKLKKSKKSKNLKNPNTLEKLEMGPLRVAPKAARYGGKVR